MDDSSTALSPRPAGPLLPSWKLRRRNSIATSVMVPPKLSLLSTTTTDHHYSSSFSAQNAAKLTPSQRPPPIHLEFLSLKSSESYTSLKDILPSSAASAAVNSPTASAANSGYEISIRNRLVKQAAWAYLQPMSSTSGPSGSNFLRRLCVKLSPCLSLFTHRIIPFLSHAFRRTLLCIGLAAEQ